MLDQRTTTPSDVPVIFSRPAGAGPPRATPALEAHRLELVRELAAAFQQACATALGGRKWFSHFEQWLWSARSDSAECADGVAPVLPLNPAAAATEELHAKLVRTGMDSTDAQAVCAKLGAKAAELARGANVMSSGGSRSATVSVSPGNGTGMLMLSCRSVEVDCSERHLAKLRTLHAAHAAAEAKRLQRKRKREGGKAGRSSGPDGPGGPSGSVPEPAAEEEVEAAAFCAVARLLALQGAQPRAGGNQAACPAALLDALRSDFGVTMEAFASPLNCRFLRYCSAAADCDAPFGSVGSFFDFRPRCGALVANPPFVPAVVARMAAHMEALLDEAASAATHLLFVVVIPFWPDAPCWRALNESRHALAPSMRVPQAEHGYYEGGQHCKAVGGAPAWKPATHDTSLFFLGSPKARAACPLTYQKEQRLRRAFRPPPGSARPSQPSQPTQQQLAAAGKPPSLPQPADSAAAAAAEGGARSDGGGWTCPACGASVFGSKSKCYLCYAPRPSPAAAAAGTATAGSSAAKGSGAVGDATGATRDGGGKGKGHSGGRGGGGGKGRCRGGHGATGDSGSSASSWDALRAKGHTYGERAHERLGGVTGKAFKRAMGKSKRATYSGGAIDAGAVNSTRLDS